LDFGSIEGFRRGKLPKGHVFLVPLLIGEDSDGSAVSLTASAQAITVRRAAGDLVVGAEHYETRAASQLEINPRRAIVRISSAENSFEVTGNGSDVRLNGEQLVKSRYESLPTVWQATIATAILGLLVFLLRDASRTLLARHTPQQVFRNSEHE
jgi:hypothetical protein